MVCIGLFPLAGSFELLTERYMRAQGNDARFVNGFASHLQNMALNDIYMSYCLSTNEASCQHDAERYAVCKVAGA